jgi:DNA-binding NtrC family response regulator
MKANEGSRETAIEASNGDPAFSRGDLLVAVGNGQFVSHEIASDTIVIGRDPKCDLMIDHPSLSRKHAKVRLVGPASVQDLESTNGTRVSGRVIKGGEPVDLIGRAGFEIGPFAFVVVTRRVGRSSSYSPPNPLRIDDPTSAGATGLLREFAGTDVNILITGETGVGKEVLAATVHELSGRRGDFVQVNCAALSETLLESELFGYERGAFTGAVAQKPGLIEAAANGTLLLDEIGEVPLALQAKLLRAIERREVTRLGATRPIAVDVRIISATNRDLVAAVAGGMFRADLFYRLDGVTLVIPPLRERPTAIAPLAMKFLEAARRRQQRAATISSDALAVLAAHPWPGNVRELRAVMERASVIARDGEVRAEHLALTRTVSMTRDVPEATVAALDAEQAADRQRVLQALDECAGNQTRAARMLGISRTTMITKLRIYKIRRPTVKS